jgi:hypothetical protein
MSIVSLSYTLDIECPSCSKEIDLTDQDCEGHYTTPIFNNRWDDLKGDIVQCDYCDHEFEITGVEC